MAASNTAAARCATPEASLAASSYTITRDPADVQLRRLALEAALQRLSERKALVGRPDPVIARFEGGGSVNSLFIL